MCAWFPTTVPFETPRNRYRPGLKHEMKEYVLHSLKEIGIPSKLLPRLHLKGGRVNPRFLDEIEHLLCPENITKIYELHSRVHRSGQELATP